MRAIFYLTFNGVHHNTNGIGRQTATMIGTVRRHWDQLCQEFGPTAFFVITPGHYNSELWEAMEDSEREVRSVSQSTGGDLLTIPVLDNDFWNITTWRTLCHQVSQRIADLCTAFAQSIIIAVDAPYLHVGAGLSEQVHSRLMQVVHCPYSSYALTSAHEPHLGRDAWEAMAYERIARTPGLYVGDICRFMTDHLKVTYSLPARVFVPFESGLDLGSADFDLDDECSIASILNHYGVPCDRPVALAFGRGHPIKGFDIFLRAMRDVSERRLHLVIIAVPYPGDHEYVDYLRLLAAETGLSYTFVDHYDRRLPRALAQWKNTRVVCCPSRLDTLPNIPMEVGMWARNLGPIVIGSRVGGIPECIEDSRTGLLFDNCDAGELRKTVETALVMSPEALKRLRMAAWEKVRRERDQYFNLQQFLRVLWSPCS